MLKIETVTVNVTQKDMHNGHRKEARLCPVALALKRHFPEVSVGPFNCQIRKTKSGRWRNSLEFPPKATEFIMNYDRFGEASLKPFKFRMRLEK